MEPGWGFGGGPDGPRDLELTLADGTTYPQRGTAEILDRQVGITTGTINIRGVFPNPDHLLRPGQYGKVRAVIDLKKGALLIPQRAVQDLQGIHQVAVVGADETVDVRTVQLSQQVGSLWIVEHGVKPGERVVVAGLDKVNYPGRRNRQKCRNVRESSGRAGRLHVRLRWQAS
jgi:membrane fusion protein (multidrug efflux system)